MKTVIITGVGGQDGRYLAEHLLAEGFHVVGINRRSSQPRDYLQSLRDKGVELIEGDITDYSSVEKIVQKYKPDHYYHLASQSHVGTSFQEPLHTWKATGEAVIVTLEVLRNISPQTRFYNAASSEMFGSMYSYYQDWDDYGHPSHYNIKEKEPWQIEEYINKESWLKTYGGYEDERIHNPFQNEETPFRPQSPYGIAKLAGYHATRLYRESYGLFACSGILFNHESELRSLTFVTRKITNYVSRLRLWKEKMIETETGGVDFNYTLSSGYISTVRQNKNKEPYCHRDAWAFGPKFEKLKLGNLEAKRDWSHASDMVRAMHLMLSQDKPDDYVVGSGETHTVREFAERAFAVIGENWENYVEVDPEFIRPAEVDYLRADPTKAREVLGWKPLIPFDGLVKLMVYNDIERTNTKYKLYGDI